MDRQGDHSIIVIMVRGPDNLMYEINANWPGCTHHEIVLRNTRLYVINENGWRPFPETVILGDSANFWAEWLMTPINRNPGSPDEEGYNRAYKRTRRIIENTIGIIPERFPCLTP